MQQNLFPKNEDNISLEDIFLAYFDCRKNKRNKLDALEFEVDFYTGDGSLLVGKLVIW